MTAQGSGTATISSPPAAATAANAQSSFGGVLQSLFAPAADNPTRTGTVAPQTPPSLGSPATSSETPANSQATAAGQPTHGFTTPSADAAKLLDAVPSTGAAASAATPSTSTLVGALKALFGKPAVKTGFVSTAAPDAATVSTATSDAGTPPALLRNVVSTLTELDKDKQQGVVPSKDLLKRAQDAVEALSGFLTSQQAVAAPLATPPAAAAPASGQAAAASPVAGAAGAPAASGTAAAGTTADPKPGAGDAAKTATNAQLAQLSDKLQSLASSVGKDQADLGTDLSQLAKQLDPKTLAPATATQLGFAADGTPAATGLTAAINGFVNGKVAPVLGQPALAAPTLKIASEATKAGTPAANAGNSLPSEGADTPGRASKPGSLKASDADTTAAKPDATQTPVATAASADDNSASGAASSPATANGAAAMVSTGANSATTNPPAAATPTDLRQAQTAYQIADPMAANLPQMAFEIARHARQGSDQFQISMDPKDLGRVDVKLAMDTTTGAVTAHLTADRPETLDLLKRDAGTLGQALSQAGLDAGKTNLQFSLNQNPSPRQDAPQDGTSPSFAAGEDVSSPLASIGPVAAAYQGMATASALNIFV